jgi:hypothetical protein
MLFLNHFRIEREKMTTKIICPKKNQSVRPVGFAAYGTADSALKARRIRGIMIGKKGAVYVGVPVKPIKTTWGLAFFNPLAKGMKTGDYVLQIFDFLGPHKILAKASFRIRLRVAKAIYPLSGESVPRVFFASGATSGTLLGGTMTCSLNHQFAGTNPQTFSDGSWILGFNISEAVLNNPFTLDTNDDVPSTDTQPNITVTDSSK